MTVPSHDGGASAAPVDEGAEEAKQSVMLYAEVDNRLDERIVKDLRAGTEVVLALLVDDRVSKHQSGLRRDIPIGKLRKSVEQEPPDVQGRLCFSQKGHLGGCDEA